MILVTNLNFITSQQNPHQQLQYSSDRKRSSLGSFREIRFPKPVELHLIRHAETIENSLGLVTGSIDAKLTEQGKQQAKQLGKKLDKKYDLAICSGMQRTQDTLKLALDSGNICVNALYYDERINERSLGILEGKERRPISAFAMGNLDYAPPEGEPYSKVALRVLDFLNDLANLVLETQPNKVLICGHTGVMRILVGIINNYDDPAEVLNLSFGNARILKNQWQSLSMPNFLEGVYNN
jgi:probable phosphoglycerate mutase